MVTENQKTAEVSDAQLRIECLQVALRSPNDGSSIIELAERYLTFSKAGTSHCAIEPADPTEVATIAARQPETMTEEGLLALHTTLVEELQNRLWEAMFSERRSAAFRALEPKADKLIALEAILESLGIDPYGEGE